MKSSYGPRAQQQPDGAVRLSQIVTTFGPGSMVDLLNDAVLIGGLDFWSYDKSFTIPHIAEPRLRDAIVERFRQLGRDLSQEHPFRSPPMGNDREPTRFAGSQVLEYPQYMGDRLEPISVEMCPSCSLTPLRFSPCPAQP